MATVTVRNGIDVRALVGTIDPIKAKPELAHFTFRAATAWDDGTRGASEEELKELCSYVQETSPVRDVLANGVPVTTSIEVLA